MGAHRCAARARLPACAALVYMGARSMRLNSLMMFLLGWVPAIVVLAVGLGHFGIWDPWELAVAEQARQSLAQGDVGQAHALRQTLMAHALNTLGTHEWAGRLVLVISGLLCLAMAYAMVLRVEGAKQAIFTLWVLVATPLFIFNSRQMFGEALSFLGQAMVGLTTTALLFHHLQPSAHRRWKSYAWGGAFVVSVAIAIVARGALLGVLPIVAAGSAVMIVNKMWAQKDIPTRSGLVLLGATTIVLLGFITTDAVRDGAGYSVWLGGSAQGVQPPSFDKAVQGLFHGLAPWSALGPVAIALALAGQRQPGAQPEPKSMGFRLFLVLWVALAFGAQLVFSSRYGSTVYLAVVPAAALIAIFLVEAEQRHNRSLIVALFSALLVGLILRDFALFAASPLGALNIDLVAVPEGFDVRRQWAGILGLFALMMLLALGVGDRLARPDFKAPYRFVRSQWQRSLGHKAWLGLAALLAALFVVAAGLTFVQHLLPFRFSVIAVKVIWIGALMPLGLAMLVAVAQSTAWLFSRLGEQRMWPLLGAGLVVGLYLAHSFTPAVSAHFSQRDVYARYNEVAKAREPLAEYQTGVRSANYYTDATVAALNQLLDVENYLLAQERRWLVFPADQLATIDRAYRRKSGRHLFVTDASNRKVFLAVNQTLAGQRNHNPLAQAVRRTPPAVQRPVGVRFGNQIELIGYTLELPHPGYVGAGESFKVRWVFRVLQPLPGAYKIFLHIEGHGQRLNGDHDPVNELYPVRYWDKGDIIIDEQELSVPVHYRPGQYAMHIGFFSGEHRLPVPGVPDNRCHAGTLLVR